jgi:proteasome lid subunit RPN8/RPN11
VTGIRISPEALETVFAHARQTSPRECCGLLIGTPERIVEAAATGNLAESPNRFLIDPEDHIRIRRDARMRGLSVAGVYHSHPHSTAYPSQTDRAEASYSEYVYVIVGVADRRFEARAFKLDGAGFTELQLSVVREDQ